MKKINPGFNFVVFLTIEPYDNRQGMIYWFIDGNSQPVISTYTSDGKLLVLFSAAASTRYVYQK